MLLYFQEEFSWKPNSLETGHIPCICLVYDLVLEVVVVLVTVT